MNKIKQHTLQSEYRSNIDEVLRKGELTKSDLSLVLTLTDAEILRLQIQAQQRFNSTNTNGTTT